MRAQEPTLPPSSQSKMYLPSPWIAAAAVAAVVAVGAVLLFVFKYFQ